MNKLIKGAFFWKKSNQKYFYEEEEEEVTIYTEKIKKSKNNFDQNTVSTYFNLKKKLKNENYNQYDKIVVVENNNILFSPLQVEDVFTSQSNAFNILEKYWKTNDTINELNIDLSEVTTECINNIMKSVSLEEIKTGIQIWETLPCRILKINVYEPESLPPTVWIVKKMLPVFVHKKVLQKLNFIKCDFSVSQKRQAY